MKDLTKTNFRNKLIFLLFLLFMILGLMIIFIGTGDVILSIPWAVISIVLLVIIFIHFKIYFNYKNNMNILVGTIKSVICFKSYRIEIITENRHYIALYKFISSNIRNQVGRKCTFVVDKKNKAYIKNIE